jgi:peptidoglycan/LPS O-acetylase OafA/YrhL
MADKAPGMAASRGIAFNERDAKGAADNYKPQLDGLRAVAVAAVIWAHWERPYQFGVPFAVGVHLFYVISGFLITGILLRLRELHDKAAAVRAFYARRILRIFPAFYATLFLAWLVNSSTAADLLTWHATFLTNILVFTRAEWPGSLSHFWSLAVEEQFYLIWPSLIVFAPRRWLVPAIVAAIVLAPLSRLVLAYEGYRESLQGVLMIGSLDSLGVGALLAVVRLDRKWLLWCGAPPALALWGVELLGAVLPPWIVVTKQLLQAMVFGWLVVGASAGFRGAAGRFLAARPVVYIGRISYGLYLVHGLAGDILIAMFGVAGFAWPLSEPWRFVALLAVTLSIAATSWHVMERPLNDLKRRFPYRPRVNGRAAAAPGGSPHLSPAGIES